MKFTILFALLTLSVLFFHSALADDAGSPDAGVAVPKASAPSAITPSPSDPGDYLAKVFGALDPSKKGGIQWRVLAGLLMIGAAYGIRSIGKKFHTWFGDDRGGAVVALLVGVLGTLGSVIYFNNSPLTPGFLLKAAINAAGAAGGYTLFKKLIFPSKTAEPIAAVDPVTKA